MWRSGRERRERGEIKRDRETFFIFPKTWERGIKREKEISSFFFKQKRVRE